VAQIVNIIIFRDKYFPYRVIKYDIAFAIRYFTSAIIRVV